MIHIWNNSTLGFALTLFACLSAYGGTVGSDTQAEFFESKVRPILVNRCGSCHGAGQQKGNLRVDSLTALLKGGKSGAGIVARKAESSRIIEAVNYANPKLQMPPSGKLDSREIEDLKLWIDQGARWPQAVKPDAGSAKPFWSVQPILHPAPPKVRNSSWVRNPIDSFVLSSLERKGMVPAPLVGRRDLLRRVYFDVVGLPPSPKEVADFLVDKTPGAYAKLVDRLLDSPRYGERWARYWLDLVRYADTNGYERDAEKPYSWKYRDYVIRALNEDKPYDRFIAEQLAGDELPDRSESTVTATGFLRLGTWDDEPNDPLQYKYERLDDLVHASSAAFLGLTVRCARCHDHKFDPISQKDYYAFAAAFYNGYLEPGDGKLMGGPPPERLKLPVLGFTDRNQSAPPLHLLINGDPRRESDVVPPGYLSVLTKLQRPVVPPGPGADTTQRRLQLARWITDTRNPLTARVIVNRIWQYHFGQGLVRTPNNFGHKGALPTHPELLDWLASSFVAKDEGGSWQATSLIPHPSSLACGWSLKKLHRLILLSNTYQMASVHPLQNRYNQHDAGNEMLWRFNRKRLDADAIRDSILAVSGQLNLKESGPGFVPTVTREGLEGLSRKGAEWLPSAPQEQNRRTVYMFLKRALIMPLLTIFDFADTTQPLEQRDISLVAPQALALLNNPFLQQQSDAFARHIEKECGKDRQRQAERVWQIALGRAPSPSELSESLAHMRQVEVRENERARSVSAASRGTAAPHSKASLWLRADGEVETDSGGAVLKWTDAAGKHSAGQLDSKARPVLVRNALNGKPAIRFDGQGRFLSVEGQPLTSQQFTIIAVVNDRATGKGHREIFSNWNFAGNIGPSVFLGLTGASSVRLTDFFAPAGTVSNPAEPFILTAISSSNDARVYQNRSELARVANPMPQRNLTVPYVIGQQGNINGEFWNGDIMEVQVYDYALSDAEREAVWEDLNRRYGIAARPVPADPALASLCHVLFNANEFLYID